MGIVAKFRSYLERSIGCSEAELAVLRRVVKSRRLKKGQSLLLEGEPFPYLLWVANGCLRLYMVDEKLTEHLVDVAIEGQFLADRIHLQTGKLSQFNIDAALDTDVVMIPVDRMEELYAALPMLEGFLIECGIRAMGRYQSRIAITLVLSTEERLRLAEISFPELVEKLPQRVLAGFLGVNPSTLSRVRNKGDGNPEIRT